MSVAEIKTQMAALEASLLKLMSQYPINKLSETGYNLRFIDDKYYIKNPLPHKDIKDIFQDSKGRKWGVCDGSKFSYAMVTTKEELFKAWTIACQKTPLLKPIIVSLECDLHIAQNNVWGSDIETIEANGEILQVYSCAPEEGRNTKGHYVEDFDAYYCFNPEDEVMKRINANVKPANNDLLKALQTGFKGTIKTELTN